jgi:hypothetical protein
MEFIQDDWDVNPNFKLSYGIRADYLKYEDNILRNNSIYDLDFGGRKLIRVNGQMPMFSSLKSRFSWDMEINQ